MSLPMSTFTGSGTTTASYVAVPLTWTTTGGTPNYWRAGFHSGAIGGTVRNTHASLTMKVKVTAWSGPLDSTGTPTNTDPTTWPVEVAEATISAASDANFFITVAHHLFYAVCVLDGSGHATFTLAACHKPRA